MVNLTKEYFDRQLNQLNKRLDGFVTKDDIKQFVTKDDIKQFVTKDDIKQFATKDDIKQFVTKDDIKQFATKKDIGTVRADLKADIKVLGSELRAEMKVLEQKLMHQNEELAAIVKRGLDEIYLKLDLREKVEKHEHDIRIIKEALHITR